MSGFIEDGGSAFPIQVHVSPNSEVHYGLTVRQYAAIELCVPDSGTPWLDEMIRQAQRRQATLAALQGLCAFPGTVGGETSSASHGRTSVDYADAALKALGDGGAR